ncbi:wall-associated receptor kinase 2-like [Papaver somniferum]|uniref:wall-associated receptor kinase 2-like n=1 Tax=Papaver somniferum TaxID=3469 RepID=UPI000E6FC810|nr:wall-associated receptor kinase 2-like [Papaver somniferum]
MARMHSSLLILQDLQMFIYPMMIILLLSSTSSTVSAASTIFLILLEWVVQIVTTTKHLRSNVFPAKFPSYNYFQLQLKLQNSQWTISDSWDGLYQIVTTKKVEKVNGCANPEPYLAEDSPFTFSSKRSKLLAVGCDIVAYIPIKNTKKYVSSGWSSFCTSDSSVVFNLTSCSGGNGCCQTDIPTGLKSFLIQVGSINTINKTWTANPCSQAIVVDKEFTGDIHGKLNPNGTTVPMMLDWVIGNVTCTEAKKKLTSYACGENSDCSESFNGPCYRCTCKKGYTGNPYLGCQDIDECKESTICRKGTTCLDTNGSYFCACPMVTLLTVKI